MKWLRNIIEIWAYEMKCALFDEGVIVFFIIVPLLYPLLYAYLYSNEVVREVPTVVVDNSHSQMSREFLRRVDATADVQIVSHCDNIEEAQEMVHHRDAYCLIYIPKEFEKDIAEMRQTTVELYSDMSGLLYYKAVLSSCTEVSLDMNKEIKASRIPGATEQQISAFQYPIEYKYVPMFNTQSGFASFIIPAVLMLIIQQTMVLGVGMMAGEERALSRKDSFMKVPHWQARCPPHEHSPQSPTPHMVLLSIERRTFSGSAPALLSFDEAIIMKISGPIR